MCGRVGELSRGADLIPSGSPSMAGNVGDSRKMGHCDRLCFSCGCSLISLWVMAYKAPPTALSSVSRANRAGTPLAHVKGQFQVADLLTKALSPPRIRQLLDYLDVDTGVVGEASEWGSANPAAKGGPGVVKSLLVLSCLMCPAKAQPEYQSSLLFEVRSFVGWVVVVVCFLFVLLCWGCCLVLKERRLKRLSQRGEESEARGSEQALGESVGPRVKAPTVKAPPPKMPPPALSVVVSKAPPPKVPPPVLSVVVSKPPPPKVPPPALSVVVSGAPVRTFLRPAPYVAVREAAEVHTPPRQVSVELPPLFSYEELIARALRSELAREPTQREVQQEIVRMRIRHAQQSGSSGSSGSEISSSLDSASEETESDFHDPQAASSSTHVQGIASSEPPAVLPNAKRPAFQYLVPEPTPIVRILGSLEDEHGNVVYDAVSSTGGALVPTELYSRPVQAADPAEQNASEQEHVDDVAVIDTDRTNIPGIGGVDEEESDVEGEVGSLDWQLANATLLLHQHMDFQVSPGIGHLTDAQQSLYRTLLARFRGC